MYCPRCGDSLPPDVTTCPNCRYRLSSFHHRITPSEEQPTLKRTAGSGEKHFDSLYNRLGGKDLVERAVDLFYDSVLADERLRPFFDDVDMESQRKKQKRFLVYAFGGPLIYDGKDLREVHQHMGVSEEHFTAVMEHLQKALQELAVPGALIQEVMDIAASTHDDVLGL
jgi:hemoglobin